MPVPAAITDLSTTPASNSPAGSEAPTTIDDYLRFYAACIAQLRDGPGFGVAVRSNSLGSAGAPAFSFVADTNTGAFSPGADIYGISTAGVERLRIGASGNATLAAPSAGTALVVTGAAGNNPLTIAGGNAAGAFLRVQDNAGAALGFIGSAAGIVSGGTSADFSVRAEGALSFASGGSTERLRIDASGNVFLGATIAGASAARVLGMADATAPTTSPAGMGQLYVEGGALKFRGSSGTVTTIAPA